MAANTYKGITVEIGGDATPLADALNGAKSRARELGTNLSSVERALKFSPDSVVLLEQKAMYASEKAAVLRTQLDAVSQGLNKVERGSDAFYRLQRELVTTQSKLEQTESSAEAARRRLAEIEAGATDAADGLDKAKSAAYGLTDALKDIPNGAMLALGEDLLDSAKGLAAQALETSQAWGDADAKIRATVGSTSEYAERMSGTVRDLYADGWGESIDGLTDAAVKAREVLGELSDQDMATVLRTAQTLEAAFGSDLSESLRGVNVLMEKFGLTATEACDLMVAGSQRGLDYTDELGDNLSEYAGRWAEASTSATQYFSMLQAGVDAGAYSLDKVGDYLNEFLTSLSDGRMADGIGNFSQSTQALWASYQAGGATAQQMLDAVVGELRDCSSETEALTLASDLWSSLGEDNALGVITSLAGVQDSYRDTAGAAEDAAQALEESSSQRLESFKRTALGLLEPVADTVLGALNDVMGAVGPAADAFGSLDDGTKRAVVSGVALAAAYPKVSAAIKTAKAGTEGLTAAQQAAAVKAKALATAQKALKASLAGVGAAIAAAALSAFVSECVKWAEAAEEARERSDRLAEAAQGVTAALARGTGDGFSGVSANAEEASRSVSALRDEIAQTVEGTLDLYSSLSSENFTMEAKNAEVERLAQEIEELSAKSSLTADEQARLSEAVRKFNDATGAGIEVVDAQTGKLSANADAIDRVTEAYENQARVKGYQDALSDLYAKQAEALMQVQDAQDAVAQAEGRLAQAQEELKAAEDQYVQYSPDLWIEYQDAVSSASAELDAANAAMEEATTSYMGLSESVGVYEGALATQVDQQGEAADGADGLAGAADGAAEAVSQLADASEASVEGLRGCADSVEEAIDLLDGLEDGSRDAGDAVEDAFRGAMGDGKSVAELTKEVNAALKDAGVITDDLTEREVLLGYATGKTGDEMVAYARDIQAAKEAQKEQEKAAEEAQKAAEEFRQSVSDLVDETPGLGEALAQAGMDAESFAGMLEGAGVSVDAFKATYEALGDVANPLQAIEQETGVYTWQMAKNLQTNTDTANAWADGMTELYSRCTNDSEVAFAQYVESMGSDNLEFLNYLLYDADVSFSDLAAMYATGQQTQADAALRVQKAAIDAMVASGDAYYDEAGQVVDKAGNVLVDGAGNVAQQAAGAVGQGLEEGSGQAADSASLLGEATVNGLMELPAEMRARGEAAGGYLGIGFGSDAARAYVAQGAASLADAARDAAIDLGGEMRDRGEYAGGMFAQGMADAGVSGDAMSEAVAGSLSSFADSMAAVGAAGALAFADSLLEGYTAAWQNGEALAAAAEGGTGPGNQAMGTLGTGAGLAYARGVGASSNLSTASRSARSLLDALYGGLSGGMTGAAARGQAHGGSYAAGILYGYTSAYSNAQALVGGALEAMSGYEGQAKAAGRRFGEAWGTGASSALATAVSNIKANISAAVSGLYTVGRT